MQFYIKRILAVVLMLPTGLLFVAGIYSFYTHMPLAVKEILEALLVVAVVLSAFIAGCTLFSQTRKNN